jgi:hypothetical protein
MPKDKDKDKDKTPAPEPSSVGKIEWLDEVADHDYAAAEAYLSLKHDKPTLTKLVARLRKAEIVTRRANDILRAAGLDPAPLDDPGVIKDITKVIEGKRLSPVLVIRGETSADIADGYHRVSMVYRINPYGVVPLKLG